MTTDEHGPGTAAMLAAEQDAVVGTDAPEHGPGNVEAAPTTDPNGSPWEIALGAYLCSDDASTGTIPTQHAEAMRAAFPGRKRERDAVSIALGTLLAGAVADGGPVLGIAAVMTAAGTWAAAKATTPTEPADPVALALSRVVAFDTARAFALVGLTDEQRDAVNVEAAAVLSGQRADYVASWSAAFGAGKRQRAAGSPTGTRSGDGTCDAHVASVLASDPERAFTTAQLAAATSDQYPTGGASGGALAIAAARLVEAGTARFAPVERKRADGTARSVNAWQAATPTA